jgi:DNA-binding MarR family transcriptional regulator
MSGARQPKAALAPETAAYVLEEQVGFHLRRAQQRATEIFGEVMAEFGVTPTQFAALAKLDDLGPTSQNQLGRLTAMDPATIFSVVGRLGRRGWVEQAADAADARRVIVSLTPEGAAAVAGMKRIAAQVSARTLQPLTRVEAGVFVELLKRLG